MRKCNAILPPDFKLPVKCIFVLLNIGTSLVAIFGNALVMLILCTNQSLKTRSNYFLLFLAGTDVVVGLIAQPITCLLVINFLYLDRVCAISKILAYVCSVSCGASTGILALIGYDRYLHLSKLGNYNKYMTNGKLKVSISVIFAYQILVGCLIFQEDTATIYHYFIMVHIGTYGTILSFYYYKSWKTAKKGMISTTTGKKTKKQWRTTKSMALLVLVFVVCWSPFFLYFLFQLICKSMGIDSEKKFYPENLKVFFFCLLCGYTNSCINPFLYYWRNERIRLGIESFVRNKLGRKTRRVNNDSISEMPNSTCATHVQSYEKTSIEMDLKSTQRISIK